MRHVELELLKRHDYSEMLSAAHHAKWDGVAEHPSKYCGPELQATLSCNLGPLGNPKGSVLVYMFVCVLHGPRDGMLSLKAGLRSLKRPGCGGLGRC